MSTKLMKMPDQDGDPLDIIRQKHTEYYAAAKRFKFIYYATRFIGGLSACVLPFVVKSNPGFATVLAIVTAVMTVFDTVFSPKDKYANLSRSTDLLHVAELKRQGKYTEYKELLDIIIGTEEKHLLKLVGMDEVLKTAREATKPNE